VSERPTVKIADLAGKDGFIRGRTFEDRTIVGPAVLVVVSGGGMHDCSFPNAPVEQFVWLLPDHPVLGPIGLVDCTFRRCTFDGTVGFAGNAEFRAKVIADLAR
jgi:hypothetical protein